MQRLVLGDGGREYEIAGKTKRDVGIALVQALGALGCNEGSVVVGDLLMDRDMVARVFRQPILIEGINLRREKHGLDPYPKIPWKMEAA